MPSFDLLDIYLRLADKYQMKFYLVYMIPENIGIREIFPMKLKIINMS